MRFFIATIGLFFVAAAVRAEKPRGPEFKLFAKFCFECHDSATSEADVDLSNLLGEQSFVKDRPMWLRAAEMLESNTMPPEDHQQPTESERRLLFLWIKSSLDDVDWAAVRAPGRVSLSRLTREEFQFAAEDLFGVSVDLGRFLPADPEGASGFSNDHASLVMTDKQLRSFLKAAEIIAAAVSDQVSTIPKLIHYEVEDGVNANWKKPVTKDSDDSTGWAFSSKLGNKYQAVSKAFDFDRTGLYRIRMRARSKGPGSNAAAWIAVDSVNDASREAGVLVRGKEFAVYETELFITKGRHTILFGYDFYGPLWLPKSPARAPLKLGQSTFDPPPYDRSGLIPKGLTIAELNAEGLAIPDEHLGRATELVHAINKGYFVAVLDNLMLHKFHYEKGYLPVFLGGLGYDYQVTVIPAFAELAKITATDPARLEKIWKSREPEAYSELKRVAKLQREAWTEQDQNRKRQVGDLFVDWIEMEMILQDNRVPLNASEVPAYLERLLPRALKRPTKGEDLEHYLAVYSGQRDDGVNHREAFQRTLIAVLVSPDFLYRTDGTADVVGVSRLEGFPLAARLSSFLWSSVPDQELWRKAAKDELVSDDAIDRQVDRMLDDDRSRRFASLFTEQWLNLTDVGLGKEPDKELFRYFSWRLAEDMREEVALVFDRILREDRSLLELLDGRETYLNERLARLYAMEDVEGPEFRLVTLEDPRRGGLLGTAAVLTSTSLATRTSPVRRGQFVLETLLGVELPSPPADVPQLSDDAGQSRELPLRESLARHRSDSKCAGCHNKIDPPGFALENYDWIGRWRENDAAGPVDSNAMLPDGRPLDGIEDLKTFLLNERRDEFTGALAKALLKYALGRDVQYFDEDALRGVVAEVRANDYRARVLVKAIARSYPFRFREIKEAVDR